MKLVISGCNSRQTPSWKVLPNGWQAVLKTVVRQRCRRSSILPPSFSTGSREARHCADNAEVEGAVPSRWIYSSVAQW